MPDKEFVPPSSFQKAEQKAPAVAELKPDFEHEGESLEPQLDEADDDCIFCQVPTPTPPETRTLWDQDGDEPGARVTTPISEGSLDQPLQTTSTMQERYRKATIRAKEELNRLRLVALQQTTPDRHLDDSFPSLPITPEAVSATPLNRRQIASQEDQDDPNDDDADECASGHSLTSTMSIPRKETFPFYENYHDSIMKPSNQQQPEIQRPTPIAPPNHDCSWKDRYLALAAEIRVLKAEMSTRVSSGIAHSDGEGDEEELIGERQRERGRTQERDEDEDLGIQGLTIVMHLRGKDDLVINTDLTQDVEEVEYEEED